MNKGILFHIVSTIIYCLAIMYINGSEEVSREARGAIAAVWVVSQVLVFIISMVFDLYEDKS